jgi:pimeloyl-ACP methyl ester carboxylesterase
VGPHLTVPVLLINGSTDKVNPIDKNAAILAKVLPQGRLVVLDNIGHLPEVETPDIVNRMLHEFFGG